MATAEEIEHVRGLLASGFSCRHFEFDGARLLDVLYTWDSGSDGDPPSESILDFGVGRDRNGFVVFTTTDGKFGVASDSEDYSGHG